MVRWGGITAYVAGLATAPWLYDHPAQLLSPFLLAVLAAAARRSRLFPAVIALLLFTFGLGQYALEMRRAAIDTEALVSAQQGEARGQGRISSVASRPENGLAIVLDEIALIDAGWHRSFDGRIKIYIDETDSLLGPGDMLRFSIRLRPPDNFRTPGAHDTVRSLARQGICATAHVAKSSHFARIASGNDGPTPTGIRRWRNRIRDLVEDNLAVSAPLVNALAIGDRGAMTQQQRRLLAESGMAHLFAISGMHLGLVAVMLYALFGGPCLRLFTTRTGIPPRRVLPFVILPLLIGYMILTGSAISTFRALIMAAAAMALCQSARRCRPLDLLATAAFLVLVVDPLALFEPSFQLSFAGAAGILAVVSRCRKRLSPLPGILSWPLMLLAVTLGATLATLPFVMFHFHILAPAAPLLNLVAVPAVSFLVIPVVLLATATSLVSAAAAVPLFQCAGSVLSALLVLADRAVSLPLLAARMIYPPTVVIVLIGLGVTLLLLYRSLTAVQRTAIGTLMLLALAAIAVPPAQNRTVVTVLDVGQGDATLLQLPGGRNYLVDGGGLHSETYDIGERLIAPALGRLGIRRLDAVILSHDHPDHRQGLVHVLKHFPVGAFWCDRPLTELDPSLATAIASRDIPVRVFPPGWNTCGAGHGDMKIFVPPTGVRSENDRSLAVYTRNGDAGLLLTGDQEAAGIDRLVRSAIPGPVSLLKVPHHGSRKSDPSRLLRRCRPDHAYISVGRGNHYGLPHPTVLDRLAGAGTRVVRTDLHGTTRFSTDGRDWSITHWKKGLFR